MGVVSPQAAYTSYFPASPSDLRNPSSPVFNNHPPPQHKDPSSSIPYPTQAFDPHARFPSDSLNSPGFSPSASNTFFSPNTTTFASVSAYPLPKPAYFQPPPQSPPSTESNSNSNTDPYRLKSLIRVPALPPSVLPTVLVLQKAAKCAFHCPETPHRGKEGTETW
ncbi:hypothetical protein BDQ17DRAFT_720230 [Cyathus striatus]|nr:hypothetical protein BDQ17DRAFT_720230 [Cyathus striatus]